MNDIEGLQRQIDGLARLLDDLRAGERLPIACAVYNSGDFSHNSSGNWLAITFDSERRDVLGMHSTSANTSRITFALGGWYILHGNIQFAPNATGARGLGVRIDGTTFIAATRVTSPSASLPEYINIACLYYLATTNYVELVAYQNSGGTLAITAAGNWTPELRAIRLP